MCPKDEARYLFMYTLSLRMQIAALDAVVVLVVIMF